MRAATMIVGAIAAASILIALAFILSPGGGSSAGTTTTIVHRIVEAPEPAPEETSGGAEGGGGTQFGGPRPCDGGEYTVEDTSCAIGAQIHEDYEGGRRGDLFAEDETGAILTFFCKDDTVPITCTGEGEGVVYFGG